MAGTPEPEETPKLGMKATIAGLVFALTVLLGFGAATAASYEDTDHHGDEKGEDHSDESHGDEDDHDDDSHGDDDDHGDE